MPDYRNRLKLFSTGIKQAGSIAVSGVKALFSDYTGMYTPGANNLFSPYSWPQLSNVPTTRFRSVTDNLGAYTQVSAVYTCVSTIANAIASLEPEFYDRQSGKTKYKLFDKVGDPGTLAGLIQQPNTWMDYRELVETFISHGELAGNMLWFLENMNGKGQPEAIYPLNPAFIKLLIDANKGLIGYVYSLGQGKMELDDSEVIHKRYTNPSNPHPFWGQGTIAALVNELDIAINMADADRTYYRNGMVSPGAYVVDGMLTDQQFKRVKAEFEQEHTGVHNFHKPLLLEGNGKWVSMVQAALQDNQALRAYTREQIYMAFGVPMSEAGNQGRANVKNDHLTEVFWRNTAAPKIRRLEAALQDLASRYDPRIGVRIPVPEALDVSALINDATLIDKLTSLDTTEKRIAIRTRVGSHIGLADIPDELPEPPQPEPEAGNPALPAAQEEGAQGATDDNGNPTNFVDLTGEKPVPTEEVPEENPAAGQKDATGPGSRGGKYWIDEQGNVRYDNPPANTAVRTPAQWAGAIKSQAAKELKGIKTGEDLKNLPDGWEAGVSGTDTDEKAGYNHFGKDRQAALDQMYKDAKDHPDLTYALLKVDGNYVVAARDTKTLMQSVVQQDVAKRAARGSRAANRTPRPKKGKKAAGDGVITSADLQDAADFWKENAPDKYKALLDAKPIEEV